MRKFLHAEKPQMKINSLKKLKHEVLIHISSDKVFIGSVVSWALEGHLYGCFYSSQSADRRNSHTLNDKKVLEMMQILLEIIFYISLIA